VGLEAAHSEFRGPEQAMRPPTVPECSTGPPNVGNAELEFISRKTSYNEA